MLINTKVQTMSIVLKRMAKSAVISFTISVGLAIGAIAAMPFMARADDVPPLDRSALHRENLGTSTAFALATWTDEQKAAYRRGFVAGAARTIANFDDPFSGMPGFQRCETEIAVKSRAVAERLLKKAYAELIAVDDEQRAIDAGIIEAVNSQRYADEFEQEAALHAMLEKMPPLPNFVSLGYSDGTSVNGFSPQSGLIGSGCESAIVAEPRLFERIQ